MKTRHYWLYKMGVLVTLIASFSANSLLALEVGDTVPYVILEGIDAKGNITVSPVSATEKPEQSFTLVEFFSVDDAVSLQNLPIVTAQSQDLINDVTTQLVAVDADTLKVREFREDYKEDFLYSVYFDPTQSAMRAFGVAKLPTVFIVDQDSKVLFKSEGLLSQDKIDGLRSAIGYATSSKPLQVGDVAPALVLRSHLPNGVILEGDIRLPEFGSQRFTVLSLNTIYSQDAANNTVAYRDFAANYAHSTTVRYVTVDKNIQAVNDFMNKYPAFFQYHIVYDTEQVSQNLFAETVLPTTFVLDRSGTVLFKKSGLLSPEDINDIRRIIR
ncbi:MAG: redoxin domain-containing protein [Bdellovibrionales bacterium]|nr:redoxin domain-containing protein [Bdellovibrionales bacterium]